MCSMKEFNLWEGRSWVDVESNTSSSGASVRFLSYNTFADCKSTFLNHSAHTQWERRSKDLLEEIKSYSPDILCLQDIDHFKEFWRPQLMLLGYDSIFKARTQLKDYHYEGVVIAYRSDMFQLFKTVVIEFNEAVQDMERGSAFRERSKTDDIGLIIFIQPIKRNHISSALCVGCAMFTEHDRNPDIRMAHAEYFAHQIELANKEFHVPVLLGMNLNDTPSSLAYNLLITGRTPLSAQVPNKCKTPFGEVMCRGSVLLKWLPPSTTLADLPIIKYIVAWRPGGSRTLGFSSQLEIAIGDCVKYGERFDDKGVRKMVAMDHRQFPITGLVSDMPYEFKVCAVNDMGEGLWSDLSDPVVMTNPDKAPAMPSLVNFADLPQLNETREFLKMTTNDWDVNTAFSADPMRSHTQLTPRDLDGRILHVPRSRVLPLTSNPREGWKESLKGTQDKQLVAEMNREIVLSKSVLRNHQGFVNADLNQFSETLAVSPLQLTNEAQRSMVETSANDSSSTDQLMLMGDGETDYGESVISYGADNFIVPYQSSSQLVFGTGVMQKYEEKSSVLLDCKEVLSHVGIVNNRQVHDLMLSSVYNSYSPGGEPMYTCSVPKEKYKLGVECMDYIFYSKSSLVPLRLLSIPPLNQLQTDGESPQETITSTDNAWLHPFSCVNSTTVFNHNDSKLNIAPSSAEQHDIDDTDNESNGSGDNSLTSAANQCKINEAKQLLKSLLDKSHTIGNNLAADKTTALWGGSWVPFPQANHKRNNCYLPNERFPSTHMCICADFVIDDGALSTQWR